MRHSPLHATRFFFATAPLPCPYLPDRVERRVVTELAGRDAMMLHDTLSLAGFRRSHGVAYAPACPDCEACRAVRIKVLDFRPSRTQRRILKANAGLRVASRPPRATREQFELFAAYQRSRHGDGDMANMDYLDYSALVEDTAVDTELLEFRDDGDILLAACLSDRLGDGLSAVYSFYSDGEPRRSLGTYMILWLAERARMLGLPHLYLGSRNLPGTDQGARPGIAAATSEKSPPLQDEEKPRRRLGPSSPFPWRRNGGVDAPRKWP